MSFLEYFPAKYEPRPEQRELVGRIEAAVKSGYRNILLCVPTGVGKSHVAVTIARALGTSCMITAQKILQDQYTRDFGFIYPVKGKRNFPCLDLYEPDQLDYEAASADPSLSCSYGNCTYEVTTPEGDIQKKTCRYKPTLKEFTAAAMGTEEERIDGPDGMCHYYLQKYSALHASHALFNYASYFQTKLYARNLGEYLARKCIIADEAHEIEEQIIGYVGHTVRLRHLEDLNMRFSDFDCGTVDGVLRMLHVMADEYTTRMEDMPEDRRRRLFRTRRDKLDETHSAMDDNPGNFCVQTSHTPESVIVKPIEVGGFAGRFFDAPLNMFMSATIHPETFCKTMGMSPEDCKYIEVPRSPFPKESRRVLFHDIRRLNYKSTPADYTAVYAAVLKIARDNKENKGIIHATTKKQCSDVAALIGGRAIIAHEGVTGRRESALARHTASRVPNILVSPSFWFGVDLRDDQSRFQIILKTPYPSLSDARTRIKSKKDPVWYQYTTLIKLLQGFGRSTRGRDDHSVTHVLDKSSYELICRMRKFVPEAYHDILGWETK